MDGFTLVSWRLAGLFLQYQSHLPKPLFVPLGESALTHVAYTQTHRIEVTNKMK